MQLTVILVRRLRKKDETFFLIKFFFSGKKIAISVFVVVKRVQPVSLLVGFASSQFATNSLHITFCKRLKIFP